MQLYYLSNRSNSDFTNYLNNVLYTERKGDSFMNLDEYIFPQEYLAPMMILWWMCLPGPCVVSQCLPHDLSRPPHAFVHLLL